MLVEKIVKENSKIIDAISGNSIQIADLIFNFEVDRHSLVFLYIGKSVKDVSVFLSVFNSDQTTIALLSSELNIELKTTLEEIYTPRFIYDDKRAAIEHYFSQKFSRIHFFEYDGALSYHIDPNIKLLLSTSGTTGSPKFVKLTEANITYNAEQILNYLPISKTDCSPLNLPVYYSYGLSVFTSNALAGATIVVNVSDIVSKDFWVQFERYQFSTFAGVPFVYEMLFRLKFADKTYPSLRYFTQAGGKLQSNLANYFGQYAARENKLFYVMYGQTEATARIAYMPPHDLLNNIDCIGVVIPGGELYIDDLNQELIYRGNNVFVGYAESITDLSYISILEELRTGDLAQKNGVGYFKIIGRLKRFIKLFGNRINLDEVEKKLSEIFLQKLYCVGYEDKILNIFSDQQIDVDELKMALKSLYQIHPSALRVNIIDSIPLTTNGKPNYSKMMESVL